MSDAKKYQYATLSFSIDMYRLMYAGGPSLGEDYPKKPLYELFDELAKDGWKPQAFGNEEDSPVWILKRPTHVGD